MLNKRKRRYIKEYLKNKNFLKDEILNFSLKFIKNSDHLRAKPRVLSYAKLAKRKGKKKSISYQTTLCLETGHYKSRINWGNLSRFAFKKKGNEDYFSNLSKF